MPEQLLTALNELGTQLQPDADPLSVEDPDAPGAVNAILDPATIKAHLENVYDVQLRYSNEAEAAIVALRQAGTTTRNGLEIIGAAVEIMLGQEKAPRPSCKASPPPSPGSASSARSRARSAPRIPSCRLTSPTT